MWARDGYGMTPEGAHLVTSVARAVYTADRGHTGGRQARVSVTDALQALDAHGFTPAGEGTGRLVFHVPPPYAEAAVDCVVKLAQYHPTNELDGRVQNESERQVWARAPSSVRDVLVPLVGGGPGAYWVLMQRADPATQHDVERVHTTLADLGVETGQEVTAENVGVVDGGAGLCDYGTLAGSLSRGIRRT